MKHQHETRATTMYRDNEARYALMHDLDTDEWYIERVHPGSTAGQFWQTPATKTWHGRVLLKSGTELVARVQQRPPDGHIVGWPNHVWVLTADEIRIAADPSTGTL